MSKQRTPKHSFVHTITVGGVVYILRFEQQEPGRYAATSIMTELPPFEVVQSPEGWRIDREMPDREQFEELLKPRLDEEVG